MTYRTFVRLIAGVLASAMFCASATSAAALTHSVTGVAAPVPSAHTDRAPSVPGNLSTLSALSGSGGGSNLITFGSFDDGEMVVVTDPTSLTGHAGLFDERYYSSIYSYAVLSANVAPANGVQREQCIKYRTYDRAYGLWVPTKSGYRVAARNWAYKQMGKPYSITAAKTDTRSFYCSKLAWGAWRYTSGLDLDGDGGFWVWPIDLVNSPYTTVFGYWG